MFFIPFFFELCVFFSFLFFFGNSCSFDGKKRLYFEREFFGGRVSAAGWQAGRRWSKADGPKGGELGVGCCWFRGFASEKGRGKICFFGVAFSSLSWPFEDIDFLFYINYFDYFWLWVARVLWLLLVRMVLCVVCVCCVVVLLWCGRGVVGVCLRACYVRFLSVSRFCALLCACLYGACLLHGDTRLWVYL